MFLRYNTRRGHRYYSVVESQRSGDNIKQKTVHYLGRIDNIQISEIYEMEAEIKALRDPTLVEDFREALFIAGYSTVELFRAEHSYHYGDIAVFYRLAELLDIPDIVRLNVPKGGGPDIGEVITIMAICQTLAPTSKRDLSNWYEETALPYLTGIPTAKVEQWNLYSAMRYLKKDRIESIEGDIVQILIERYDIELNTCLYDLTSTFFYGKSDRLKKHGYSRDYMPHLAQVVIGLALTKDDGFPIKHWVHPGNTTDVKALPKDAVEFRKIYTEYGITLVFDRGPLSEKNVRILDGLVYDFICGLKRSLVIVKDIIREAKEKDDFEELKKVTGEDDEEGMVYGTVMEKELWGKQRKVVVCYSEPLAQTEKHSREKAIEEANIDLEELQKKTEKRKYSHDSIVIKLHDILEGVTKYFDTEIIDHPKSTDLSIHKTDEAKKMDQRKFRWIDEKIESLRERSSDMAVEDVREELKDILGDRKKYYRYRVKEISEYSEFMWEEKKEVQKESSEFDGYYVLMSTDLDVSMKEIIEVNDSRDAAEKAFQTIKNPVNIRPIRHWVPRMVRAHIYICILGFLLRQMLRFLMKRKGLSYSINEALLTLRRVKLIQMGEGEHETCLRLTRLNDKQKELFDLVDLSYEPPTGKEGV